jgi:hypothetical protein
MHGITINWKVVQRSTTRQGDMRLSSYKPSMFFHDNFAHKVIERLQSFREIALLSIICVAVNG